MKCETSTWSNGTHKYSFCPNEARYTVAINNFNNDQIEVCEDCKSDLTCTIVADWEG